MAVNDVIVSTRSRIARNIKGINFPSALTAEADKDAIINTARNALSGDRFSIIKVGDIERQSLQQLINRRLISPEFAQDNENEAVLSSEMDSCVMLDEEDHFRIQSFRDGFDPEGSYDAVKEIAALLGENCEFAHADKLGYITSCPINLGTGLRISVIAHLPIITATGAVSGVLNSLGKMGISVRSVFGEGSGSIGDFYQISNQVSLGITEEKIISNLKNAVSAVEQKERDMRGMIYENNRISVEDKIMRAYGILRNARLMELKEAAELLSLLNVGISLGMFKELSHDDVYNIVMNIAPGTAGTDTDDADETEQRADTIRKALGGK